VLGQLVSLGENLTDGWRAEGQDGRGLVCLSAFADLGHPVLRFEPRRGRLYPTADATS
jgi:hypothetical protein